MAVEPKLLRDWLAARSVARGLPQPVPDRGGFRVDTGSDDEVCRWVFPQIDRGITEVAHAISAPGHLLKACGSSDELRAALPPPWKLQSAAYFMIASRPWTGRPLPAGYVIQMERVENRMRAEIRSPVGELAASGYAAETADAFAYDRIVTTPDHRRKGLGHAVMAALHQARQNPNAPELLVATEDGRALYQSLGWQIMSPYATAFIAKGVETPF